MSTDLQLSIEFGVSVLQNLVDAGYDFLKTEHQKRDLFGKSTEKYVRGLIERFGEVKVLGMNKSVPLLSLYVRANILEKISARAGAKMEDLETFFDFDRRAFGQIIETKDGETIANDMQRFIVLGKPGAGKTTFLKYLALAMVHRQSVIKQRRLPIFITLRDWADKRSELMEYITEQFDICGFEQPDLFVENMFKQGNCLVLFDGLDEVSQEANLDGIIRSIRDFTDKYSSNQFVMSCRVAAYNHWFERFTDVEMADFDEKQIETFVNNWFRSEPKTADECIKHLKGSPQLKELSSVPLLLTLLCITYDENNDFPANRAELYKDAVEALLRKWDSSRRIRRDDPYKQLSLMQKENMFARIAFGTFMENRYFIRETELTRMIGNFIGNLPAFKTENLEVDSTEVLRTIESHHGIFVERAKHIHSFAHLTFQEYFTAKYIVDNASNGTLKRLVEEHLYDDKWKEVFLLVAGMLSDADELLLLMLKKNRELLHKPVLNNIVDIATKMLLPGENMYSVQVRISMAISLILAHARAHALNLNLDHALNLVRALVRALDLVRDRDLDRALYRDLDRALYLDLYLARANARDLDRALALARANARDLDRALDLDRDRDQFPNHLPQIISGISSFLNGNILIVNCTKVTYLSKSTRDHILSNMLAPLSPPS